MAKKLFFLIFLLMPNLALAATSTAPLARVFDAGGKLESTFAFFEAAYEGGADLASGDINGDGLAEVLLCPGSGHQARLRAYSAYGVDKGEIAAYADNFRGGCYVSAGDINGDKQAEAITGAGFGGGPHVRAFQIGREVVGFFGFAKSARQGVRIAAADLGSDGKSEFISFSNYNAPAAVGIFGNDGHKIAEFKIKELNGNGLSLAAGDFDGDGQKELAISGGYGNKAEVLIYSPGGKLIKSIAYHRPDYSGGLNLSAGNLDSGPADELIVTESFNGAGVVSIYGLDGRKSSFTAISGNYGDGLKTAVGDVDGDGANEIIAVPERIGLNDSGGEYKRIAVDLSSQTLHRFQNGLPLDKFLISSGKPATPTPAGEFAVTRKRPLVRMSWYYGAGSPMNYDLPNVPWVASFSGPYTIHGTYWHRNFGQPMSHGCVNMYIPDAKTVYDWSEIGTPVVVK